MPDQGFLDGKTISRDSNYTSLFMKHSCFLRVGGWRVSVFSHLYFKCRQTRGRLLNYWNGYQKLNINRVKWSWRKIELQENHFWEYLCLDLHIARALTALSLTLSTKIHVRFLVIKAAPFQHFGTCIYM